MPPIREPSRLQPDLREDIWTASGRTVLPWATQPRRPATEPSPSRITQAERTCPPGCVRDHETD